MRAEGMTFAAAPEYPIFASGDSGREPASTTRSPRPRRTRCRSCAPCAPTWRSPTSSTLAPALAAEIEDVPCATLIPHIYPDSEPDFPIYSIGARLPRSRAGRWLWRRGQLPARRGLEIGRRELNAARAELGLAPLAHAHGGISQRLALVATFPQLEYPRTWPEHVHVVGPLMWATGGRGAIADGRGKRARRREDAPRARRALHRAGSRAPAARRVAARPGKGGRAGACHLEPPPAAVRAAGARQRKARRLGVLFAHDAPLRRGRLPRRARHARARTGLRLSGRREPRDRRHERERGAARLAGRGGALPGRFTHPRPLRLAVERVLQRPAIREQARELAG